MCDFLGRHTGARVASLIHFLVSGPPCDGCNPRLARISNARAAFNFSGGHDVLVSILVDVALTHWRIPSEIHGIGDVTIRTT